METVDVVICQCPIPATTVADVAGIGEAFGVGVGCHVFGIFICDGVQLVDEPLVQIAD